jgi:hypothetical protein
MAVNVRCISRTAISAALVAALTLVSVTCSNSISPNNTADGADQGNCESGPPPTGPPPPGQPDEIIIQGATAACQLQCVSGTGIPVLAIIKDINGTVLTNQTVTWASSDPALISVAGKGLTNSGYIGSVSCLAPGTATISATDGALTVGVTIVSE